MCLLGRGIQKENVHHNLLKQIFLLDMKEGVY